MLIADCFSALGDEKPPAGQFCLGLFDEIGAAGFHGVPVISIGKDGKKRRLVLSYTFQEQVHVTPGLKVEIPPQLSVDGMLNDNIHDGDPAVYQDIKLLSRFSRLMTNRQDVANGPPLGENRYPRGVEWTCSP